MTIARLILVGLLPLVVACTSSDDPNPTTDVASPAASQTERTPGEANETTPVPAPTSADASTRNLPAFDLANYDNGDEIVDLTAEVGSERRYPDELRAGSTELPLETVRSIVTEFLADSRIVITRKTLRNQRIDWVEDYCDNGTRIYRFFGPFIRLAGNPVEGQIGLWEIVHTELTEWNEPYIAIREGLIRNAYVSRGWDAVPSKTSLTAPGIDGFPGLSVIPGSTIRVFDNPDCEDPQPITEYSAAQWSLLGLEAMRAIPDELRQGEMQLDPARVVDLWKSTLTDVVTFSNMNGYPLIYGCGNRGVVLRPRDDKFGEVFTVSYEDGSDVTANGIWVIYDYDNPIWGVEHEFLYAEEQDDPYRNIIAAEISNCSIDEALEIAEELSQLD